MNSSEIFDLLMSNKTVEKQFKGVLASDQLNFIETQRPALYVVNTDTSDKAGLHWVCIYLPTTHSFTIEFFDPLANSVDKYNHYISTFLIANGPNFIYSNKRIQNYFTSSCGLFCILFSVLRCEGRSFSNILSLFTDELEKNEKNNRQFLRKIGYLSFNK